MGCILRSSSDPAPLKVNTSAASKHIKLVLLGNSGVGKTSIVDQYINKRFSDQCEATVGVGYYHQRVKTPEGRTLELDIWDTGGQERYRALLPLYYREATVAIICYDVTSYPTFEACEYWYRELKRCEPECRMFLVGNKTDIPVKRVDAVFAAEYARGRKMEWAETSAKTAEGVAELFTAVTLALFDKKNSP